MQVSFTKRKQDCLSKEDKSSIGKWDSQIKELCNKINKKENYYTLSSCSGRIVLIKNLEKKQPNMFAFRSHKKVSFKEIKKILGEAKEIKESIIFKQEQPIVHIACRGLKDAEMMLRKGQQAGFKHSGIISISENRIVIELIGSEQLSLPIIEKNKILVNDNFLEILIREANSRLEKGWEKINRLEREL